MQEELARIEAKIVETQELLKDPVMGRMAIEALVELKRQKQAIEDAMVSSAKATEAEAIDQNFTTIIIEARQVVGGAEAKICAVDCLLMYTR